MRVQVGNTVHHLVTFLAALAIAFWRGWQLTLVMVALLPLIAVAGGIPVHLKYSYRGILPG